MSPHPIIKKTAVMTLSTLFAQGVGVFTSVAMRNALSPASMGVWSILQVILGYCGYASFGTTKALARDYPILQGRGEFSKAEGIKNLTFTFAMTMSMIPAAGILIACAIYGHRLEGTLRTGLIFVAFFLFIQRFYDLLITLLRSEKKFTMLSFITSLNAVGMFLAVFLLVRPFGFYGLLGGTAFLSFVLLLVICSKERYRFKLYWSRSQFMEQVKLGLPLLLLSFLATFFSGLDKLLIARHLGLTEVGHYSLAMMVSSLVMSFPMMLSNVLYPHTMERFGRSSAPRELASYLHRPVMMTAAAVPLLGGAAAILMPLVSEAFMKDYTAGLEPMRIYLGGLYFLVLAQFSTNILTALDRYWISIGVLAVSIGIQWIVSTQMMAHGFGLKGAALGAALSFFCYGIANYTAASFFVEGGTDALKRIITMLALSFSSAGGVLGIYQLKLPVNILADTGLKLCILAGLAAFFLMILERLQPFIHQIVFFRQSRAKDL